MARAPSIGRASSPTSVAGGSLSRPRRWPGRRARRLGEDGSSLVFGVRLGVTVLFTFALVAIAAFLILERNLANRQIDDYAASQRADVKAFELQGRRAVSTTDGLLDIDRLIDGVAQRPGTLEALLIDQRHVIRATANDALLGARASDRRIDAALLHGKSYAGREGDTARDKHDFEFVAPVDLPSGRYAYEVTYDHRIYDAHVGEVRTLLALVAGLGLLAVAAVFYLVGGRRLMRDHRMVLHRATRDGLTDLPNQRAYQDEFPQAVAAAVRYRDPLALALLDIDDFKLINDRHGHPQGDAILERVASILRNGRPGDRAYRIGGDEFALVLARADAKGARTVARRLRRDLGKAGVEVSVGVSALRPGMAAETLRAEADSALYEAKRQGGGRVAHFEDIRGRVVVTTPEKKEAVRKLIEEARMATVFQPIWNLEAESLLGLEALMRPDPSYGLSGPAEAFDIAEQLGQVHPLDVLCVESALRAAPALEPGVLLFLNLAPLTLDLDAAGSDWLLHAVEAAGLRSHDVVVEVTERFGGRTASVVKSLERLREQGFRLAVDDVGTGSSGLEMLRLLDAEFVKIDRSIVTAAATEPGARAVMMAIATFAHQTGAFVIAEGIEDVETLQFLREIDESDLRGDTVIQGGQGFELGRPSPELTPRPPAWPRAGRGKRRSSSGQTALRRSPATASSKRAGARRD
ncbi:MAG TPA: bifunctional diguanylate cyclase/phosphodiesterase [Solirubrobacteraceae bacterium]